MNIQQKTRMLAHEKGLIKRFIECRKDREDHWYRVYLDEKVISYRPSRYEAWKEAYEYILSLNS